MYQLVRKESGYRIVRSEGEAGSSRKNIGTPLPPLYHCLAIDLETWKKHLLGSVSPKGIVRDDITKSWARCTAFKFI